VPRAFPQKNIRVGHTTPFTIRKQAIRVLIQPSECRNIRPSEKPSGNILISYLLAVRVLQKCLHRVIHRVDTVNAFPGEASGHNSQTLTRWIPALYPLYIHPMREWYGCPAGIQRLSSGNRRPRHASRCGIRFSMNYEVLQIRRPISEGSDLELRLRDSNCEA
jgi:hypothetical protein